MRGRKPRPTAARRLEGNPGHRPLNATEPSPPPLTTPAHDPDAPPPELEGQVLATAEWRRLAPLLRRARQITEADRSALVAVCLEWARYIEATKQIQKLGLVVKAPSGYPITNPYLPIATKALAGCNKLWPELGLTPSSRSRVNTVGPAPEDDPFSEFDQAPGLDATEH